MQDFDLPDTERRNNLEGILSNLERAREYVSPDEEGMPDFASELAEKADGKLHEAIMEVRGELDDIPEWDGELVKELVLEHADRSDTDIRRMDWDITIEFEVGQIGNKTECRYEFAPTAGNEWFFVRGSDEDAWEEVWTN